MVCYVYLKTSVEMNALLDKRIHNDNKDRLAQVTRHKRALHIGTAIAVVLSLADAALYDTYADLKYLHGDKRLWLYYSFRYLQWAFELICLGLWGVALWKIARKTRQTDNLMPNKRMFALHGTLLVLYFVFFIATILLSQFAKPTYTVHGWYDLCAAFSDVFENASFCLVLYVMLPITKKQQARRQDFQTFLLNGMMDVDQLEEAIIKANPDMTEDQKQNVRRNCQRFNSFLEVASTSSSVVSEMCIIDRQALAYDGFQNFRMVQAQEHDVVPSLRLEPTDDVPVHIETISSLDDDE